MTTDRLASRRQRLAQSIRKAGVTALLVNNPKNVTCLTGLPGEDSCVSGHPGPGVLQIFSDSRFETQLQDECPGISTALEIRTSRTTMTEFARRRVAGSSSFPV